MKLLVKITPDNVSNHNRATKGYEFVQTVASNEEGYSVVANIEDNDFYPQGNKFVLNANGNEVFDPKYPNDFDFVDYKYHIMDIDSLDSYDDAHIIRAIENENPSNIDEIKEFIND